MPIFSSSVSHNLQTYLSSSVFYTFLGFQAPHVSKMWHSNVWAKKERKKNYLMHCITELLWVLYDIPQYQEFSCSRIRLRKKYNVESIHIKKEKLRKHKKNISLDTIKYIAHVKYKMKMKINYEAATWNWI